MKKIKNKIFQVVETGIIYRITEDAFSNVWHKELKDITNLRAKMNATLINMSRKDFDKAVSENKIKFIQ